MITSCHSCVSNRFCLPAQLNHYEMTQLDNIVQRNPPLHKGEPLFESGSRLTALYAIRLGVIKNYTTTSCGTEQITAFYSVGDVIGLDAIGSLCYSTSAKALDTSMVCKIPFESLERLSSQIPLLRRQLLKLMSLHIQYDQEKLSILKKSAKARLASFIYNLLRTRCRYGLSASTLHLPMSRTDIGNYLGLSLETISRLFSQLQYNDIIATHGRYITVNDSDQLAHLAFGLTSV